LHVSRALDVSVTEPYTLPCGQVGEVKDIVGGSLRTLAECERFAAWECTLQGKASVPADIRCLLCIEGEATLTCDGCEDVTIPAGASVYLPEGLKSAITGEARVLWIK
jgi:mannose-6-phosphate isomerase class I